MADQPAVNQLIPKKRKYVLQLSMCYTQIHRSRLED